MKLKFEKNIQFTRTIKADNRLREFNFRKLGGLQEGVFTIDVVDDRGNRIMFKMQKADNVWKIVNQPLPDWVIKTEKTFHELIEEELEHRPRRHFFPRLWNYHHPRGCKGYFLRPPRRFLHLCRPRPHQTYRDHFHLLHLPKFFH